VWIALNAYVAHGRVIVKLMLNEDEAAEVMPRLEA